MFNLGGATVWPHIGVSVFPDKGDAIYWHNLQRNSAIDYNLTHKACPVLLGSKWICNKWIGYNSQWVGTTKCGLFMNDIFGLPNPKSTIIEKTSYLNGVSDRYIIDRRSIKAN